MEEILREYEEICGDYGRNIFTNKVLPLAQDLFSGEKLRKECDRIILKASECKTAEVDNYLRSVVMSFNKRKKEPLKRSLKKLESLLVRYNHDFI